MYFSLVERQWKNTIGLLLGLILALEGHEEVIWWVVNGVEMRSLEKDIKMASRCLHSFVKPIVPLERSFLNFESNYIFIKPRESMTKLPYDPFPSIRTGFFLKQI